MDTKTHESAQDSSVEQSFEGRDRETEGLIAGRSIRAYFDMIALPVAVAVLAVVAVQFADVEAYVDWLVYAVVAGHIGWQMSHQAEAIRAQAITAGAMALGIVALVGALAQFVAAPRVYNFFAIITEPMLLTVVGGIVAGGIYWIVKDGFMKEHILPVNKK